MIAGDALNYSQKNSGQTIRIRYYTESIGSVWDDERTLAQSGNDFYISGVVIDVSGKQGSDDEVLFEEGRLKYGDLKMYLNGSIPTTSGIRVFTMTLSGLNEVYQQLDIGLHTSSYLGVPQFKKVYLRQIQPQIGSLY